ncbi:hypothetical protein CKO44_19780 [Rubrivivax gelatinosus]|uniref:beta-lactamase hydrolase domain-containing protein n=1 Tax=Rubrivivax gelatinosus TaxID=28068 RepID=UPI001905CEA2|nr:sulfur transferase domain-containing protein [Rubrivivax gelatinosus]MBK1615703.1 hypothetical protein [Rubrivivax gelatinosus]MBZ8143566.1 hypothetical protein [Rubrivivax gelatinosus]
MNLLHRFTSRLSPKSAFAVSMALAAAAVLAQAAWSRHVEAEVLARVAPHRLAASIDVTGQLQPADMAVIGDRYVAVVDLRPDGEAVGQPSSAEMQAAALRGRVRFVYLPVPHGEIPEESVARLKGVLETSHGAVLLYCRSGKRAARTWALAEASRPSGLPSAAILAAVRGAGQNADDLQERIQAAVLTRDQEKP